MADGHGRSLGRPIRVLLVDDHAVFRSGLTALLTAWDLTVVGQAGDGDAGVALAGELQPDVVFMDLSMPGRGGLDATHEIRQRWPGIRVVVLTASDDDADIVAAIRNGAEGYLRKDLQEDAFTRLVEAIKRGEPAISPEVARRVLQAVSSPAAGEPRADATLTEREHEVLDRLARGASNRAIGEALGISEHTVAFHVHNILAKLGLHGRAEAIAWALEHRGRQGP